MAEAGDDFGLKAGRREVAAQLVDSFMEEAKVVYVIYKVWTAGFLDWLAGQGVSEAERQAELDRLTALLAYPDGSPLEPVSALGRAGRPGRPHRQRHPQLRPDHRRGRTAAGAALGGLAAPPRPLRRPDVGRAGVRGQALRRGAAGGVLPRRPGAVHPGALHGLRHARARLRVDPRAQPVPRLRSHAGAPRGPRARRHAWATRSSRTATSSPSIRAARAAARCAATRWRAPALASWRPTSSGSPPSAMIGRGTKRASATTVRIAASPWRSCRWSVGVTPSGSSTRPDGVARRRPNSTRKQCTWTVYKTLEAIPESVYRRIGHIKPELPVIQPGDLPGSPTS